MSQVVEKYFKEWEISEDDYDLDKDVIIGAGGNGVCKLGSMKEDGPRWKKDDRVVVKIMNQVPSDVDVARELLIPCAVKLDGVFPFYGYVRTSEKVTLVSQFIGKTSLENIITSRLERTSVFGWNNQIFAKAVYKIAKVMSVLHKMGFIHRDLKPENIVFDGRYNPFLVDFGSARSIVDFGKDSRKSQLAETWNIGTDIYMAPEQFDSLHGKKVDVYAFGMTLYVYFMKPPLRYDDGTERSPGIKFQEQHIDKIKNGVRFEKPKDIPECYWQLITRCWAQNPNDRPSFDEICAEMERKPEEFSLAPEKIKGVKNRAGIKTYTDHVNSLKGLTGVMAPQMRLAADEVNYWKTIKNSVADGRKRKVIESAEFIYQNSVNVKLGTDDDYKKAAELVGPLVAEWKPESWASNPLHPAHLDNPAQKAAWIFLIDTLNFAFWTPPGKPPFTVTYAGKEYTGYWSLCASIRRALDDGVSILDCNFWKDSTADDWARIFRSDTETQVPLLDRRVEVVNEAGKWLAENFGGSAYEMIRSCENCAITLVNKVMENLASYRDQCNYKGRSVFFLKRAQILAADLHYGFLIDGDEVCKFKDIDEITMFADYRVPQVLRYLNLITYTDELVQELTEHPHLESGSEMECEIRACSILAVEKLKDFIGQGAVSVLIDFALWDYAKANSSRMDHIPIHKTKSVFY